MNTVPLKSWATPFVIGAFIISAVTGLLIFFDIEIGMVEPVHKWLSWLLLGSVFFHVLSNLKPFTRYFSQNAGRGVIGAAIAVTILSLLPFFGNNDKEHDKENPGKIAVQVLESSSVKTIALVLKTTPQQLVERLGNNGIIVNNPSLTVREIAKHNGKIDKEVLGVLLQQTKASSEKNSDNN
ncbi:MAG: DUF4405 domain-containing protein [Chlorobiaceae bacterium]|jgi:hypothetical protein